LKHLCRFASILCCFSPWCHRFPPLESLSENAYCYM
jgi:hypothetical protein